MCVGDLLQAPDQVISTPPEWAERVNLHLGQLSLMHGLVPLTAQTITAIVLACAIGGHTRRWHIVWLPAAVSVAVALAMGTRSYVGSLGVAGEPAPSMLWCWVGLTGLGATVLLAGWRGAVSARP